MIVPTGPDTAYADTVPVYVRVNDNAYHIGNVAANANGNIHPESFAGLLVSAGEYMQSLVDTQVAAAQHGNDTNEDREYPKDDRNEA